jgi:hypothetical protein
MLPGREIGNSAPPGGKIFPLQFWIAEPKARGAFSSGLLKTNKLPADCCVAALPAMVGTGS